VARGIAFRCAQSLMPGLSFAVVVWVITGLAQGRAVSGAWIAQVTALMALSLAGQLLFGWASVRDSWLSSYQMAGVLRLRILEHLRRLPVCFHQARRRGDTVTVLTSDMQMLENFFSDGLPRIAQALGPPLAVFLVLLWQDWRAGLAAAMSVAVARMIEYVQGVGVIRAFNQIRQGQENLHRAIDDFRDISLKMVVQLAVFGMIIMLGVPLLIWLTGTRVEGAQMAPATAITVLVLTLSMYATMLALIGVMEAVRMADASLTRMGAVSANPAGGRRTRNRERISAAL